jgi:hypothetical protein
MLGISIDHSSPQVPFFSLYPKSTFLSWAILFSRSLDQSFFLAFLTLIDIKSLSLLYYL